MTNPNLPLRPSCALTDITDESRFVQKIEERIIELIDDTLMDALESGTIIDTHEWTGVTDEEKEEYEMKRSEKFIELVLGALARR